LGCLLRQPDILLIQYRVGNVQSIPSGISGDLPNRTVALNWYVNPHVRFMADYEHVFTNNVIIASGFSTKTAPALATSEQNPDIFMFRTQIDW